MRIENDAPYARQITVGGPRSVVEVRYAPDPIDDDEVTAKHIAPPKATAIAPWWRRMLAWFVMSDKPETFCASCYSRLGHVEIERGICFWCAIWGERHPTTEESQLALEHLSEEISRPAPTTMPGDGESTSH